MHVGSCKQNENLTVKLKSKIRRIESVIAIGMKVYICGTTDLRYVRPAVMSGVTTKRKQQQLPDTHARS